MKKIALLVIILAFSMGMSTLVLAECPSRIDFGKIHVHWSDEFNGNALNMNNWEYQYGNGADYGIPGWGNEEKQYYNESCVKVANGNLAITAKESGGTYYSGRIRSWDQANNKPKVSIGNGYVEARIKFPSIEGIWPAFWMLGNNQNQVGWPKCGEIDIEESFNNKLYAQATIHYPNKNGSDVYDWIRSQPVGYDKTQYNTYGVYRDGNGIGFYLNGKLYAFWFTSDIDAGKRSVLNNDYHLLLNMAVGGRLAGGVPKSGTLPVTMYVDYVRYYQEGAPATKKTTTLSPLAKVKIKSLKNIKKRKLKVTLKKVKKAQGYQIRWCDNKSFDGYEQKNVKKVKYTIKGLDKKTKYWVKARAFRKDNGTKRYGKWSAKKSKKIKK